MHTQSEAEKYLRLSDRVCVFESVSEIVSISVDNRIYNFLIACRCRNVSIYIYTVVTVKSPIDLFAQLSSYRTPNVSAAPSNQCVSVTLPDEVTL